MGDLRVPEVFDMASGVHIKASEYLGTPDDRRKDEIHAKRRELQMARRKGEKIWVCALCHEPIHIAGGYGNCKRRAHFRHFGNSPRCPYQHSRKLDLETIRKIKYNGAKESPLHRSMKERLANSLDVDPLVKDLQVEQTFFHQDGGRQWRRPDIACGRGDDQLVFEVQISSDFLEVILGREEFYREQGVFILWIFNRLDPDQYTARDIYVGNNKNCFVFNERVQTLSAGRGELVLECHYKVPHFAGDRIQDEWKIRDVTLGELTFDPERMQAFWFDYDQAEKELTRVHLLREFREFWCTRLDMDYDDRLEGERKYEEEFFRQFGIQKGWTKSKAAKVLDGLFSIEKGEGVNYDVNLFGVVDAMLNSKKPFTYVVLWALDVFGHRKSFKGRIAFKRKVQLYREGVGRRDPAYRRERKFDILFMTIFPRLAKPLSKGVKW